MMTLSKSFIILCVIAGSMSRSADRKTNSAINESNQLINPQIQEATIINSIKGLALDISATQWEQRNNGNVVLSPVSISALLSLILLAARGNSHLELKVALRLPNTLLDSAIHKTYQTILGSINQSTPGVNITLGSQLFIQEGTTILGAYTEIAQNSYNTPMKALNFTYDPVGATRHVNQYVEEGTQGLIKNIISQPFPIDTKFVAVNTIYFKGAWKFPFTKSLTRPGLFDTGTRNITVPMMSNLVNVRYLNEEQVGFDMISLPYEGEKYEMIIITPRGNAGINSLQRLEYTLDSKAIDQYITKMRPAKVSIKIPKMKLSQKMYLKKDLQYMGANSIFDPTLADLGRLTTNNDVFLNDVVHEAIIEITEEGTVAAAASAGTFDRIGGHDYFELNKPSIIMIRDVASGLTLFYSRMVEPEPIIDESFNRRNTRH